MGVFTGRIPGLAGAAGLAGTAAFACINHSINHTNPTWRNVIKIANDWSCKLRQPEQSGRISGAGKKAPCEKHAAWKAGALSAAAGVDASSAVVATVPGKRSAGRLRAS